MKWNLVSDGFGSCFLKNLLLLLGNLEGSIEGAWIKLDSCDCVEQRSMGVLLRSFDSFWGVDVRVSSIIDRTDDGCWLGSGYLN